MVIGKEVPSAPTCVRVSHVTATSSLTSWLPANFNYHHAVCVNHVKVRTVKPGIFRHTISGLSPNTIYRVTVKAKNIHSPIPHAAQRCSRPAHRRPGEIGAAGRNFARHLAARRHQQPVGLSNGVPVTVYADGRKVTEVASPTGPRLTAYRLRCPST